MGLSTPSTGGGAPKDAEYVTGSSNSELTSETVVSPAGDILTSGSFGSTVSLSPGFDSFTQVDASNPSLLIVTAFARTDGSSGSLVSLAVDESGGTTADWTTTIVRADADADASYDNRATMTAPLQAGAQFQIDNTSDPAGSNQIDLTRALVITP